MYLTGGVSQKTRSLSFDLSLPSGAGLKGKAWLVQSTNVCGMNVFPPSELGLTIPL